MKRNFVDYKDFEKMKENSLSTVVYELVEAEDHLARTLGASSLTLESFDEENVIYQKDDGTFVKSHYTVSDDAVTFDNLEEMVIDEASEVAKRKDVAQKMLEAILDDKEVDANMLFEKYMEIASAKHRRDGSLLPAETELDEAYVRRYTTRGKNGQKVFVRKGAKDPKKSAAAKKGHRLHSSAYKVGAKKRHRNVHKERSRARKVSNSNSHLRALSGGKQYTRGKKHCNEWLTLTSNVFEYADFIENGYVMSESVVRNDEHGNVASVKIPSSKTRNEGKILKMHYDKMIKQDSPKTMRENGLRLAQNGNFAKAMAELKRHNNTSDSEALEETLTKIVSTFPSVLYLTQEELATSIGYALEQAGVRNFVDTTCNFMAEGILRTAHEYFDDKVDNILKISRAEVNEEAQDKYIEFQRAISGYFPTLDEAIQTEFKVFEDLYNAVLDVRKFALESQNEEVRSEANEFVSELECILKGEVAGNVDFAVEVADWLNGIAEANIPGSSDQWVLPKTPHHTVTGDHPQMAKNAKVSANPGQFPGEWDDIAMASLDNKHFKNSEEARNRSWGNKGGKDTWPTITNPIAKPSAASDWVMKGDKSVTADTDGLSNWQSSDTWAPDGGLQNPYIPKAADVFKQKVDNSANARLD